MIARGILIEDPAPGNGARHAGTERVIIDQA